MWLCRFGTLMLVAHPQGSEDPKHWTHCLLKVNNIIKRFQMSARRQEHLCSLGPMGSQKRQAFSAVIDCIRKYCLSNTTAAVPEKKLQVTASELGSPARPRRSFLGPSWRIHISPVASRTRSAALRWIIHNGSLAAENTSIEDEPVCPLVCRPLRGVGRVRSSHAQNGTWQSVPHPPGRQAISNRWVFKIKRDSTGAIACYKGRPVVRDFSQVEGVDYHKIFPPSRLTSFQLFMVARTNQRLFVHLFDIETVFLYGTCDKGIYMAQPPGYEDSTMKCIACPLCMSPASYGYRWN